MPKVPYDDVAGGLSNPGYTAPTLQEPRSLWAAGFRQENSVFAAASIFARDPYEPDPEFDFKKALEASSVAQARPNPFLSARSQAEFNSIESTVVKESRDRELLTSAGWAGIGVQVVAGIFDPTILLPGGIFGRGVSVIGSAARLAKIEFAAVSVQETLLQQAQVLRTPEESAINIATTTILAGLLGAAVGGMSKREFKELADKLDKTGSDPVVVPLDAPSAHGVGAQATPEELLQVPSAGGLAPALGTERLAVTSPVLRNLQQKYSATVTWAQAQMDTTGVTLEGNAKGIASNIGGDVNTLRRQWDTSLAFGVRKWKEAFKVYRAANGKLSRKEFFEEAGRTVSRGVEHENAQINAVAKAFTTDITTPLYKEAMNLGFPGFDRITPEEAAIYAPRNIRKGMAIAQRNQLEEILTENAREQLETQWQRKQTEAFTKAEEAETAAKDVLLDQPEADALAAMLQRQQVDIVREFPDAAKVQKEINDLRARAKVADDAKVTAALRAQAKVLEKESSELLKPLKIAQGGVNRRLRNLTQGRANLEQKQQKVLDLIEKVEDQQLNTLSRAITRAQKLLGKLDTLSDDAIEAELEGIQDQIDQAFKVFERGETSIAKREKLPEGFEHLVSSDVRGSEGISIAKQRQETRALKITALNQKLEDALDGNISKQEALTETITELQTRTLDINNRRAVRLEALRLRAGKLDPEGARNASREFNAKGAAIRNVFYNAAEEAEVAGPRQTLSFRKSSEAIGRSVAEKLVGQSGRHPYFDLLMDRGPEIARTLHIDLDRVWSNGRSYGEFIEHDIEKMATKYVRTMGADVELYRKFGTHQPLNPDSALSLQIKDDFKQSREQATAKLKGKALEKELTKISKTELRAVSDLQVGVDRIRHLRGLPDDPSGAAYRAGRIARQLNTTRMMGSVVLSSIPDIARPLMKHGLVRTFRDGFLPLVTDFKRVKLSLHEAQLSGTALDMMIHGRSNALFDVMDEYEFGTPIERTMQYASNHFGLISGFDGWNTLMKGFTANITIARLQDSLQVMMQGGSKSAQNKATRFLAAHGIDGQLTNEIWTELQRAGGSNRYGDTLLPNTESWINPNAIRAYRAALARNIDDTIITPGTELPVMVDANEFARVFFQFRSFTFSSTSKILIAGAQDLRYGDMSPLIGTMGLLGLGAFGYYLWAISKGGKTEKQMRKASVGTWANEAITRSGIMGVLSEVYEAGERIPGVSQTFGDQPRARVFSGGPIQRAIGPSLGGLVSDVDALITTIDDPNQRTRGAAIRLLPYNNLFWLRGAMSAVDKAGSPIPEQLGLIRN